MRIEATLDGIRITLEKANLHREGVLHLEEHDFTLSEAERILEGLPTVITQARELADVKRQYERRNLRQELERLEQ